MQLNNRAAITAAQCFVLMFVFAACGRDSQSPIDFGRAIAPASVERGASLIVAPCATCDCPCEIAEGIFETMGLYAGATSKLVGHVTVAVFGSDLVVTITTTGTNTLSDTHLNVNLTPPASQAPGQFQYQHENLGGVRVDTYLIPIAFFGTDLTAELYIAVSAGVNGQTATAWNADCRTIFPDHKWKSYCHFHLPPCIPIRPPAPANVSASDCSFTDKVRVSWSAVGSATGYDVLRSSSQTGTYSTIGSTTTATQFDDTTAGTAKWWYKVVASQDKCKSEPSAPNSGQATIPAPLNVQASDCTSVGKITVTWGAVSGVTSYTIYRSTSATGTFSQIGTSATTSFDDTTVGTSRWWYKVGAENAYCSSDLSAADAGNPGIGTPLNVQATDCTHPDKVVITWNAVAGATGYTVYRASASAGPYTALGSTTTATTWTDTAGVGDSIWFYKVSATSAYLCDGAQSTADAGNACPPTGPCKMPDGLFETMGLYAGSTSILVGSVTLAISGDNLIVTIKTNSPYTLTDSHLYLGSSAPGGANAGSFPYQHSILPSGSTVDTYTIALALLGTDIAGGSFNIAVSAGVNGQTATAWNPDCRVIFPSHNWKSYCDFEFPPCV